MIIPGMRPCSRCASLLFSQVTGSINPPGADRNTWIGHRAQLDAMGYGFLLLFNGREYAELKASGEAAGVGKRDAAAAVSAAKSEGFPLKSIIFLDQEQGGRMLPEQRAYIHAWVDGVNASGYRAGIYCSGIPFRESARFRSSRPNDIRENAGGRDIKFFISNDQCGPAPGCVFPAALRRSRQERRGFCGSLAVCTVAAASRANCFMSQDLCR